MRGNLIDIGFSGGMFHRDGRNHHDRQGLDSYAYSVVGHRTRTGTSTATENGTVTKSVTYAGLTKEDVQSYIDALAADGYIQTEGTKVDGNAQSLQIAIESSTEGKVILIDIAFDPQSSTTLTYTVTDGTLTRE